MFKRFEKFKRFKRLEIELIKPFKPLKPIKPNFSSQDSASGLDWRPLPVEGSGIIPIFLK